MSFIEDITPYHLEVLREIGNIGAGHATTSLSKILNNPVEMKVPRVNILSFDSLMEEMGGADKLVASVFLRVEGEAPGSMFFMLPVKQAEQFIHLMTEEKEFSFERPPFSEMATSSIQELGNIVAGAYLSSLSDFTNLDHYPSVPELSVDMLGAALSFGLIELSHVSDYAILIDTAVSEKSNTSSSIKGHLLLLPDPESFEKIFHSLGVS